MAPLSPGVGRRRIGQRLLAEFRLHVGVHRQAEDCGIETVEDGGDIEFAVPGLDLSNIRDALLERRIGAEVPFQQVIGLPSLPIRFGDTVRLTFGAVADAHFLHDPVDCLLAEDMYPRLLPEQQCLIHTLAPIGVVARILRQIFQHCVCQSLVFPRPVPVGQILVKSLSADPAPIPELTDRKNSSKLERKGARTMK